MAIGEALQLVCQATDQAFVIILALADKELFAP
jgi:hypothetical protein